MRNRATLAERVLVGPTMLLLATVLIPCVLPLWGDPYWGQDPRGAADLAMGGVNLPGLGLGGAAWLQTLAVFAAGLAVAGHLWLGGRLDWVGGVLVLAGIAACVLHMPDHIDNTRIGGAWVAAAATGFAAAHLCQHAPARRWVVAAVVAMLVPFLLSSLLYKFVEHPMTVDAFYADEAEFLKARGWTEGSMHHEQFKRRLAFDDAIGPFALSNVYGSVVAGFAMVACGVLVGAWRRVRIGKGRDEESGRSRGLPVWFACMATLGGVVTVWLTHSRGAIAALVVVVSVVALLVLLTMKHARWQAAWVWLAPVLIVFAVSAVLVRGAIGPPKTPDDPTLSLLFRYHYWLGSVNAIADDPVRAVTKGLGQDGFRRAYLLHKPADNPEEVTSAHNLFVDQVAMLGLGGLAWACLLGVWMWRAGRAVRGVWNTQDAQPDEESGGPIRYVNLLALFALAVVVFGTQYLVQIDQLFIESAAVWVLGVVSFVLVSVWLSRPDAVQDRWAVVGSFGGACVVLVHNQIEMTWFQVGSAPVVWLLVGAAGGLSRNVGGDEGDVPSDALRTNAPSAAGALGAALIGVILMASFYAGPITRHQGDLASAAIALRDGQGLTAIEGLQRASEHAPQSARPYRWRATLWLEAAHHAANVRDHPAEAVVALDRADAALDEAESAGLTGLEITRWRARVAEQRWQVTSQRQAADDAVAAWRRVIASAPHSIIDRLAFAEFLWSIDRQDDAAAQYRAVLKLDERAYLDPLRQLTQAQREVALDRSKIGMIP